ncbi:MAG: 6-phosphogluconolactonase [Pseudomonadota bacterium]
MNTFDNNQELTDSLCERVVSILSKAIAERGEAILVVSGGRTPKPLFEKLSHSPLPWSKVTILLADERWVLPDSDDSNDKLVKTTLLKNKAAQASYIGLFTGHESAKNAEERQSQKVGALPTFDVVILGMGTDGHTASLFPCCDELDEGMTSAKAVIATQPKSAPYERLSLTKQRLLNSRHVFFHITGDDKWTVLDKAMASPDPKRYPISEFVHSAQVPTEVFYAAA